jgi:hypothetical protein
MRFRILLAVIVVPLCAQNPVTEAVKGNYNRIKQNLIETAEVMPEADYGFKLTPAQRTFAEWIEHTALSNYAFCSSLRGSAPPEAAKALHGLTEKAVLSQAFRESFAYCDAALSEMDDRKAAAEISIGDRKLYPITPMVNLVGSLNEHYGNLVGYLRSKGLVPPSTARASKKR